MADLSNHYGSTITKRTEFTRPADVTGYAVGDSVASVTADSATTGLLSLASVVRETGGSGYIVGVRLWTDQVTCTAQFRGHFYKKAQPAAAIPGDNAPMTLLYLNFADRIGSIDLPAMKTSTVAGASTAAGTSSTDVRHFFSLDGLDSKDIYFRIETLSAFTPASGQKFYLEVATENN